MAAHSRESRAHWLRSTWLTVYSRLVLQAQIKLEAFGFAIADATRAIELDPNYVKVSRYFAPAG
jgi:hypothetical protein